MIRPLPELGERDLGVRFFAAKSADFSGKRPLLLMCISIHAENLMPQVADKEPAR